MQVANGPEHAAQHDALQHEAQRGVQTPPQPQQRRSPSVPGSPPGERPIAAVHVSREAGMLCRQWWVLITSHPATRSTCSYAWGFVNKHRSMGTEA